MAHTSVQPSLFIILSSKFVKVGKFRPHNSIKEWVQEPQRAHSPSGAIMLLLNDLYPRRQVQSLQIRHRPRVETRVFSISEGSTIVYCLSTLYDVCLSIFYSIRHTEHACCLHASTWMRQALQYFVDAQEYQ